MSGKNAAFQYKFHQKINKTVIEQIPFCWAARRNDTYSSSVNGEVALDVFIKDKNYS